jgi:hypothetical protein
MNYVLLMEDLHCFGDLSYDAFYLLLFQRLALMLTDVIEQVAVGHELRHHIVCLVVLEHFDELQEILTVNASHFFRNF